MNKIEAIKATKDGLDVLPDLYRYARLGFEAIPEEDHERLKWYGLFHRKQTPGYFMLRLRIPNGILTAQQLRTISSISHDFGRDTADLTTRQGIQLRWIRIEDVPEIFRRLHCVGLSAQQTGMDNSRNVVGCPIASLDPAEVLDATALGHGISLALLGHEFSNLPRKINISISGCRHDCGHAQAHDIGLTPAFLTNEMYQAAGFNAVVGGALGGVSPKLAEPLDVFVYPEQVVAFCRAVLTVFRDNGPREQRTKARLKWLISEWGIERFRAEVERAFGKPLARAGASALTAHGGDHIGVNPQRQTNLFSVGLLVPTGRITAEELADLASLAEAYGTGELRLTSDQNIILVNIHKAILDDLLKEPLLQTLSPMPSGIMRGLVVCTGKDYCHFALNDTKGLALHIVRELEQRISIPDRITLNVSGCINACGMHQIGQLGLMAARVRQDTGIVDGFDVFAGGQLGPEAQIGTQIHNGVTIDDIVDVLEAEINVMYQLP